jgi:PAS domain S-box-containing protein
LKKTSFTRFRILLALLIAVLLSFYLASTGISIWYDYKLTKESAEKAAKSLVSALDEHAGRAFGEADQLLLNVINAINAKGGIDACDERTLHELFLSRGQHPPQIGAFIAVNAQGILLASSRKYPIEYINVSEREYFVQLRDHPTSEPYISRPLQTVVTKVWRVNLARGLRDASGRFQGAVVIGINPDYFSKFYRSVDVGEGGFVDLVRKDGYSLIHEPFSEKYLTFDFGKYPLFTEQLPKAPVGTYFSQSPMTFKTYLRSYRTVMGFPLVAVISLSKENIFKPWHTRIWRQGISAVILLSLVSILSLVLFRHLKRLEIAENTKNRLIGIIESSDDAIIGKNLDGEITSWNRGAERIYGYSAQEILGKSISIVVPDDRRNELTEVYQKIGQGQTIEHYESGRRRKDGQEIYVSQTISPIKDAEGNIVGISTISRDITRRKLAEMERDKLIVELRAALAQVKTLTGLLPICAHCKKIRDDQGYWQQIEAYIRDHSEAEFSHGICPDCLKKHYSSFTDKQS